MSRRLDIEPRTFSGDNGGALERLAASVQEHLDLIPTISLRWVLGYVATGTAGTAMPPVEWPGRLVAASETAGPAVALVVRCLDAATPAADVGSVRARLNFKYDAGQVTLFEPEGLTADSTYDLVVLFVGGV